MKKEMFSEAVIEVIGIDANIICTSGTAGCSDPNETTEIDDN